MKSVMNHTFSMIPEVSISRSSFDRSSGYKTTFNEGYLIPFFVDEVLPGDTFQLTASLFARLSTPIVPFMDNVFLETFFFYVPSRLLWDNFQKFMGEQENPDDSTDYIIPTIKVKNAQSQSIFDYFGIPTNVSGELEVNALPFRAYNLIYNEWFRDENLQDSLTVVKGDSDDVANYALVKRGKRHDYFTSALPWPQKGDAVDVPISGVLQAKDYTFDPAQDLPKNSLGFRTYDNRYFYNLDFVGGETSSRVFDSKGVRADFGNNVGTLSSGTVDAAGMSAVPAVQVSPDLVQAIANRMELTTATQSPVTINELRQAFQIQKLLERDARGGTRYTEILRAHFGVISPDGRLQRPEFLGGSSSRININPVQQTSGTTDTSPQGNLAAYGVVGDRFHGFSRSFTEHGYIIGLCNVRADLTYQQGLNRLWSRRTRYDFYWPVLAHLGEQTILNKEIYAQGNEADDKVFGYQERYAEYRYKPSLITGKFRSTDPQSLDVWHLSQEFTALPTLSSDFIEDNPPINRVVAVQDEPHFLLDCYFKLRCVRPMPVYSVPGLVDHF